MKILNAKQLTVFAVTTGLTLFILISGGAAAFSENLRITNPEAWAYALARSFGSSVICQALYLILGIVDLFRKKNVAGWFLCSAMSVATLFIVGYILPAPRSPF